MRISVSVVALAFFALSAVVVAAKVPRGAQKDVRAARKEPVPTREMERINWMEFKEVVPSNIQTGLSCASGTMAGV